jgi:hypothetical protein
MWQLLICFTGFQLACTERHTFDFPSREDCEQAMKVLRIEGVPEFKKPVIVMCRPK